MAMNSLRRAILISGLLLVCIYFFSGCVKSNNNNVNPQLRSIAGLIESASNLTLIDTAIGKAGLDSILTNSGPFTIFLATDPAWTAAGFASAVIYGLPDSVLRQIVLYSVITGSITSINLPVGPNSRVLTATGDSLFITSNPTGIYVNGINMVTNDVLATNGVIDAMSQLLLPPAGTIIQIAQADTNFSYFNAALARTAAGQTNVSTLLSNGSIYTLFLPINAAFRSAGYLNLDSINNANPDSLARILTYHIIPKRVFTSDFGLGSVQITLLANSTVALSTVGGAAYAVKGANNGSVIVITTANIMARNGVIHTIGQLLLP